jgi:LmbE family N-acetylglucosaminyl deacetylase
MRGYSRIYLSPHLDDAVLSCGGRIWQQTRAGESVAVVTVFAGTPEPDASLSSYAQGLHARWEYPVDAVEERQKENREALALLGADVVDWPYRDCIYRKTPDGDYAYASEEALWGRIHPAEADLTRELTERMSALPVIPQAALYVPLALGGHVDHRIVRRAAEGCMSGRHTRIWSYYEDFPYAEELEGAKPGDRYPSLAGDRWQAELVPLADEALEAKIAAIAHYRSQMSTFWSDRAEMATSVRAFARRTGEGMPAERYWRPTESRSMDANNL